MDITRVPTLKSKVSMDTLGRRKQSSVSPTKATAPVLRTETRANRHRRNTEEDSPKSSKTISPGSGKSIKRLSIPVLSPTKPTFSTSMSSLFTAPELKSKMSSSKLRTSLTSRTSDACSLPKTPVSPFTDPDFEDKSSIRVPRDSLENDPFTTDTLSKLPDLGGRSKASSDASSRPCLEAITKQIKTITEELGAIVDSAFPPRVTTPLKQIVLPIRAAQPDNLISFTPPRAPSPSFDHKDVETPIARTSSPLRPNAPNFTPKSLRIDTNTARKYSVHDLKSIPASSYIPIIPDLPDFSAQSQAPVSEDAHQEELFSPISIDFDLITRNPPLPYDWMTQPYQQQYASVMTACDSNLTAAEEQMWQQYAAPPRRDSILSDVTPAPIKPYTWSNSRLNSPPSGYSFYEWREFHQAMDDQHRVLRRKAQTPVPFGFSARAMFNQPGKKAGFHRKDRKHNSETGHRNDSPVRCLHCQSNFPDTCGCMTRWHSVEDRCWNCGSPGHILWQCDVPALTRYNIKEGLALANYVQTSHFRQLTLTVHLSYKKLAALNAEHEAPLDPSYILNCKRCPSHRLDDILRCLDYVISWQGPQHLTIGADGGPKGDAMDENDWKGNWDGDFSQCPKYWVLQFTGQKKKFFFIVEPFGKSEIHTFSVT